MTCTPPFRVYAQYRDKPKALAWYEILQTVGASLCDGFNSIRTTYVIDAAVSAQLDIIGRIVDVSRSYESQLTYDPDQFGDDQFGDDTQFGSGKYELPTTLSDEVYRLLIKAKIAKNNSPAQVDDIIGALIFITGDTQPIITDYGDMSFSVAFSSTLTPAARLVLLNFDVVPRPQGVKLRGFIELPTSSFFGAGQFGEGQFGGFY